jgi:DNA gyrase subunit A
MSDEEKNKLTREEINVDLEVKDTTEEKVTSVPVEIEDEMKSSYLGYAMSVIASRALPDVRDGLKPVHRRILYSMNSMGLSYNKPYKKSARIVGDVLGKYHPHGDSAVYNAMVRMAQSFSLRYPLVDGQGNFGSIDGDSPAAMRYTEARLAKVSNSLLDDIGKDTVDFAPNFDGSLKEPVVMPTKLPNLLVNGTSGIAVGMATNIPPHHMGEICDATSALIDNPDISVDELIAYVKGPDFPTAAEIHGTSGIISAYKTGKGKVVMRSVYDIDESGSKKSIIFTEIPYQLNKADLLQQIAAAVTNKRVIGVSDLRDESDRNGIRIVVELKRDANEEVIVNQLFKYTNLQMNFHINMLALVNNIPKLLTLPDILKHFVAHRKEVTIRRITYELNKAKQQAHLLEGIVIALDNLDDVIAKIKASADAAEAKATLVADYSLSEVQAQAILDTKLQRLSSMERQKVKDDHKALLEAIDEYNAILSDERRVYAIIKDEMVALKESYSDMRRTKIYTGGLDDDVDMEDLIKRENVVVTLSKNGYIKRLPVDEYRVQNRGGRGIRGATTYDEDVIIDLCTTTTHSHLLCITNKGRMYWLKPYRIPETSRTAKGKPIVQFINISSDERVTSIVALDEFSKDSYLTFMTKQGIIKKTELLQYANPRSSGIIAIKIGPEDEVVRAIITHGADELLIATQKGYALRCSEQDVRPMGRSARGVKGISLRKGDRVIDLLKANHDETLLTVTQKGYGKRTRFDEYRLIGRGGKGVININVTPKNGDVVAVASVAELDELLMVSQKGIVIRTIVKDIALIGRNTQGVRVMRLDADDTLSSAAKILLDQEE